MIRTSLLRLSFLLAVASLPLHVSAKTPKATLAAPAATGVTQVEFSTNSVSKWTDLPIGTYRVPNSDVIISGHQKNGAGLLFGVIGVAIQNSIQAQHGKEAMASAEQVLTFSIDDEAKALLQAELAAPAYAGKYSLDAGAPRKLEVTGAVVMSFSADQQVLPYAVLRAKLLDAGGSKLWTTRYIASRGVRKPLVGAGSWTADDGGLRPQVSALLKTAIHAMLKDIVDPYPRDGAQMVAVQGYFPHVNKPLQVLGYKLGEADGQMMFLPNLGTTIVFGGVNILDTASVTYRPMVKGDKFKLLKPAEWTAPGQVAATTAPAASAPAVDAAEPTDLPGQTEGEDASEAESDAGASGQ